MDNSFFVTAISEFDDTLENLCDVFEQRIVGLSDESLYAHNVNDLFRTVHSLKALSSYLNYEDVFHTLTALENILSILRYKKAPAHQEVIDWMLLVSDHIVGWMDEVESNERDFLPLDVLTLNMISGVVTLTKKASEILKELNVLYIGKATKNTKRLAKYLETVTHYFAMENLKKALASLGTNKIDILLLPSSYGFDNVLKIVTKVKDVYCAMPILIFETLALREEEKDILKRYGIEHYIPKPLDDDTVFNKLTLIAGAYFKTEGIKFLKSPLLKIIEKVKPLPVTMIDINTFRQDDEAPVSELTTIIMRDAQLSVKLLKTINSSQFNFNSQISSIQHAVSLMGKERVIALAMQSAIDDLFELNLSPYGVTEETYYTISQQRMNLMMHWYKKVSLSQVSVLTTAALLGSIGQILIANDIIDKGLNESFKKLVKNTEPLVAEVELTQTTAEDVTADVMTHWGLDDDLIHSIRYSRDLGNAPDEIKPLALAVYAVFTTVPSDGTPVCKETVDYICELLTELNFDANHFLNAITKVFGTIQ